MATTPAYNTFFALDGHYYQAGTVDPTVAPGIDATRGTIYIQVAPDGVSPISTWVKDDNGLSVSWSPFGGSSSSDLDYKNPVDTVNPIATNINLAAPGASINGVIMAVGMSFLVVNQTVPSENGIYDWNGAAVPATRRADANTNSEVTKGMFTWVNLGPTQRGLTGWILTTPDPIVIDVTALSFSQVPVSAGVSTRIPGLFYVASNGTDANPSTRGAIASPFATIQAAISQAVVEGYGPTNQLNVLVMPSSSTYAGFTTSPGISVSGIVMNRFTPRVEHANIVPDGSGVNPNTGNSISNLQLRSALQPSLNFAAGNLGRWVINNCRIIGPTLGINALFMDNAGSVLELENCSVVSDTATAAINYIAGGLLRLNGGQVESLTQAVLVSSGANFQAQNCRIISTSAIDFAVDSTGISFIASSFITNLAGGGGLIVRAGSISTVGYVGFNVNAPGVNYEVQLGASLRKCGLVLNGSSTSFIDTGTVASSPLTGLGYSPSVPGSWPVGLDDVAEALDYLAGVASVAERENALGGLTALQIGTGIPVVGEGFIMGFTADHATVVANLEGAGLLVEGINYTLDNVINPGVTTLIFDAALIPFIVVGQNFQVQYGH